MPRSGSRQTKAKPWRERRQDRVPLCRCISPTVRSGGKDTSDHIDSTCALVLEVLGNLKGWNGRIHMSKKEKRDLLETIEASSGYAKHLDGQLRLEEILACIERKENRTFLLQDMPESIAALACADLVEDCFADRDKDNSGKLDATEWIAFLEDLENLHHAYLLRDAFRQFRAFFGRGLSWVQVDVEGSDLSSNQLDKQTLLNIKRGGSGSLPLGAQDGSDGAGAEVEPPQQSRFQVGLDPEWKKCFQDFSFYSANNHPLHGIFSCSPDHPLSSKERMVIEVVTVTFTYLTIWLAKLNADVHFANGFVFTTVYVTLPGVVLWWVLFLLFICPKLGMVDEAKSKANDIARAHTWQCVGAGLGYAVAACVIIGALGFAYYDQKYIKFLENTDLVMRGRVKGYLVFWFLQTFVYFNPLVAWGQPDSATTTFGLLGDLTGLGQWRIERQRFQWVCAEALKRWDARQHRERLLKDQHLWRMPRSVVWEYQAGGGFTAYADDCNEFIEHKHKRYEEGGKQNTMVFTCGRTFRLDFKNMDQSSRQGTRKIRRTVTNVVMDQVAH